MRFLEQRVTSSPDHAGYLRVIARFEMESSGSELEFWFDLPETYRGGISQSGNPWLILMIPVAMEAAEDISLSVPVDPLLVENLRGLMAVWHYWFPTLRVAEIKAPFASSPVQSADRRALFFSGGADSFFTLLRHDKTATGSGSGPVDILVSVGGFDLRLSAGSEVLLAIERLRCAAHEFDKAFLPVITNLRDPQTSYDRNWILSHGCAMGVVAHLLEGELGEVLISSSYEYGKLLRIGSHPLTDPLLSSRHLRVVHDGTSYSRPEKIALVGTSDRALRNLRVCYAAERHFNCSRCPKCLFTMVTLDAFGLAEKATTFDWSAYRMEAIAGLLLDDLQIGRAKRLIAAAKQSERHELVAALQRAIDRTVLMKRGAKIISRLPYLWRFEHQALRYLSKLSAGEGNRLLQWIVSNWWERTARSL